MHWTHLIHIILNILAPTLLEYIGNFVQNIQSYIEYLLIHNIYFVAFLALKMSLFISFFFDTFLSDFFVIIYVLIDISSYSSFTILCTNLHAFCRIEAYMVAKKS